MSGAQTGKVPCQIISGAGEALSRARALLLQPTPQNLDIACSALAGAIAQITDLQTVLTASPSRHLTPAVVGLRKEVDLVSRMLESAASYHAKLIQCMIEASISPDPQSSSGASVRPMFLDA